MKICLLADGRITHTDNWIRYFAQKGHQIDLISFDGYAFSPLPNVTVHTISSKFPRNIKYLSNIVQHLLGPYINAFKIRGLVRTINPDILHAHYLTDYGLVGYLLHLPRFVVTVWGSDILVTPHNSRYNRYMAKLILNAADLVTGDSEAVTKECLNYCNQPEKIKVIQWGVDVSLFHERLHEPVDTTKVTILSTRNFDPLYNIDTIVKSVPSVVKKHPDVRYVLKNRDSEKIHEFQQLANSLDVTGFIEFVSRNFEYHEFPELHYNADIFVSVPSSDSSSISLLEAMACGLPAIVSDIPANHEWIKDGWNGLIVPVRDPEKLAAAIQYLIENPDRMRLFGKRNAQIIRERADREKHLAHMEYLYRQLLENKTMEGEKIV